jgi:hypothetical protein
MHEANRKPEKIELRNFNSKVANANGVCVIGRLAEMRMVSRLQFNQLPRVSVRAVRERNAGNHADKTSPRVFHGMPGVGRRDGIMHPYGQVRGRPGLAEVA